MHSNSFQTVRSQVPQREEFILFDLTDNTVQILNLFHMDWLNLFSFRLF
jgi:hypothetical protein